MMKIFSDNKRELIGLLITVCLLLTANCSKQLYPDSSFQNIRSHAEKKMLKDFMDAGTGKAINTHKNIADSIIQTAKKYIGVPHCMGGTSMKCMDCSGLLVTVFAKYGIYLPHNSEEQARYGKIVTGKDKLIKGDLVFFIRSYETDNFITHSGIYIGNNNFIHTSTKNGVTITSLSDPWWKDKFILGTRLSD